MHLTDWLIDLHGHKRRVGYIEWHPTAENVLVSAGFDHLVRIFFNHLFDSCFVFFFYQNVWTLLLLFLYSTYLCLYNQPT